MHCIVTGASSFLGSAVCRTLAAHGHQVTAFRHSYNEEDPARVPASADIWVHFAWAGEGSSGRSDPGIQQYNLEMSLDALEQAIRMGCRKFLFAGSQAEYGHAQDGTAKKESGETVPVSEYGRAKLLFAKYAEARVEAYNHTEECTRPMRYVHMRLFSVYGPGDHAHALLPTLLQRAAAGEAMELGPCTQLWNYLHIDDAAEAVAALCEKYTGGIYNIGSLDTRPLRDYIEEAAVLIAETQNCGSPQLRFGQRADNAEGPADLWPDIDKLLYTGFRPKVSFREGIRNMLDRMPQAPDI